MSIRICIDPGHGGKDPGAVNHHLKESTGALQIALLLRNYFEKHPQYQVCMTRESDTYVSLTKRCNISNQFKANAFISIHLNSAENKTATGIEILHYTKSSKLALSMASNVQSQLVSATHWKNRGVKPRSNLTVLKKTKAPAILVECGFISNATESTLLFQPDTQDIIAYSIFKGVKEIIE